MKIKWFKTKKWHTCAGYELSKKWAKTVTTIAPVRSGYFNGEWDFCAEYSGKGPGYYSFRFPITLEKSEVINARKALVEWVKEVQGE